MSQKLFSCFFFSCELLQLYVCLKHRNSSNTPRRATISNNSSNNSSSKQAAAAAADMLGDDKQQPIPGADPAGGIAVDEAIRNRAVRQRDESMLELQTNASMARNTAMGKLDLSELLRRKSKARSAASAARRAASDA